MLIDTITEEIYDNKFQKKTKHRSRGMEDRKQTDYSDNTVKNKRWILEMQRIELDTNT